MSNPEGTLEYKTSKAMKIWLAIVVAVLLLLFMQTRDQTQKGYNLVVCADKEAIGSELDVDGKKAAVFEDAEKHGLKGAVTWVKLSPGEHLVELVERQGGTRVSKKVKVTGKHYLRFDSGKSQEPNASNLVD